MRLFRLYKSRTMKMNAPYDVLTHQLSNPEEHHFSNKGRFLAILGLFEMENLRKKQDHGVAKRYQATEALTVL